MELKENMRIVQELVPGKQITLSHIIANPDNVLYTKLGLDPKTDYTRSAIGVLTVSPAESAVIAADISIKSSGADIGFVDRFTGTLIISGSVSNIDRYSCRLLRQLPPVCRRRPLCRRRHRPRDPDQSDNQRI